MTSLHRFARVSTEDGRKIHVEWVGDEGLVLSAAPWLGGVATGERIAMGAPVRGGSTRARLLAPVEPSKILCVGRNYRAHAKELGNEVPVEPMIFYKPPSSLLDPGGNIELPDAGISARIEHEAELGVVIGKRVRRASLEEATGAIFGLTIVCDVTARDLQKKDGQWWRAKGMDTFCPVGPSIVTGLDPHSLAIRCTVDGEVRQSGSTADMIFSIAEVIRHVSRVVTLEPGDLIATGTPEGVGPLVAGNTLEIEIDPIGVLRAAVVAAE